MRSTQKSIFFFIRKNSPLFDDLSNDAGADRVAAFADSEAQTLFHSDRADQLDRHRDVVARHDHFN